MSPTSYRAAPPRVVFDINAPVSKKSQHIFCADFFFFGQPEKRSPSPPSVETKRRDSRNCPSCVWLRMEVPGLGLSLQIFLFSDGAHLTAGTAAGRCRENNVGGAVQGRYAGVLDNADDETDAHDLHGDVIGDTEDGAGKGNQHKGAAGDAGTAAGAEHGGHAHQKSRAEADVHTEGVHGSHRHDNDGDGRAGHIDGAAERNGHGVRLTGNAEAAAEMEVNGQVGRRGAGEEGIQPAVDSAGPDQRIRIPAGHEEDQERVDDESDEEHGHHENDDNMQVIQQVGETAGLGAGTENKTHDAKRRETDDKLHDAAHGHCQIHEHVLGGAAGDAEKNAESHAPDQDGNVVTCGESVNRVIHGAAQHVQDHLRNRLGGRLVDGLRQRGERAGKSVRHAQGCHGREQHGNKVKQKDGFHLRGGTVGFLTRDSRGDENKDQKRRYGFQG